VVSGKVEMYTIVIITICIIGSFGSEVTPYEIERLYPNLATVNLGLHVQSLDSRGSEGVLHAAVGSLIN
jgi:hypothetical protein